MFPFFCYGGIINLPSHAGTEKMDGRDFVHGNNVLAAVPRHELFSSKIIQLTCDRKSK